MSIPNLPYMYEARNIHVYTDLDITRALADEVDYTKALLFTELNKLDEAERLILGVIKHCLEKAEQTEQALYGDSVSRESGEGLAYVDVSRKLRGIVEVLSG